MQEVFEANCTEGVAWVGYVECYRNPITQKFVALRHLGLTCYLFSLANHIIMEGFNTKYP